MRRIAALEGCGPAPPAPPRARRPKNAAGTPLRLTHPGGRPGERDHRYKADTEVTSQRGGLLQKLNYPKWMRGLMF
jgi:hypothetical protein